jgi:hypothetical protein
VAAVLRSINLALGAAMILLGLALPFAAFIDTGHAPETDAFRLIQFHCALTGAVSLLPRFWARRDILIVAPVLMLGGVNAWLGALASTAGDPQVLWSLALAASSAACLGYLFATDVAMAEDTPPGAVPDANADLLAPDFGAGRTNSRGRAAVFAVALIVLYLSAVSVVFFFGGLYCELLKLALIERRAVNLSGVFENVAGGAGADFLLRMVVTAAVVAVVYGIVFLGEAVITSGAEKRLRDASADFSRDLSRAERIYLRDALEAIDRHLEQREFGRAWPALYAVGVTILIAMMIAGPFAVALVEGLIMDFLATDRAMGAEIIFYSDPFYIGGVIGGFFAGTLMIWSLFQRAGARRPAFGEYLYARTGWNSLNNGPRSPEQFLIDLVRFVRSHRLKLDAPFEPATFLAAAFREHERTVYRATAWAFLLTALAVGADVARFRLVDEYGVIYSNYLQFTTKRIDLADIDYVEVTCALLAPDDDDDVSLRVNYELVEQGTIRIDLLEGFERDTVILDRLIPLDARLAELAVLKKKADGVGWARNRRAGYVDACAEEIAARYDADIAARLTRLIRTDIAETPAP